MRDIVGELLGLLDLEQSDLILVNDIQARLANLDSSPYKSRNRHLGSKFHCIREEI